MTLQPSSENFLWQTTTFLIIFMLKINKLTESPEFSCMKMSPEFTCMKMSPEFYLYENVPRIYLYENVPWIYLYENVYDDCNTGHYHRWHMSHLFIIYTKNLWINFLANLATCASSLSGTFEFFKNFSSRMIKNLKRKQLLWKRV